MKKVTPGWFGWYGTTVATLLNKLNELKLTEVEIKLKDTWILKKKIIK